MSPRARKLRCGTGVDLEQAQADGKITAHDADEIHNFAAFLRCTAGIPSKAADRNPEQQAAFVTAYAVHYPDDYARAQAEMGHPVTHAIVRQVKGDEQDTLCVHEAAGHRTDDLDAVTCRACLQRIAERRG